MNKFIFFTCLLFIFSAPSAQPRSKQNKVYVFLPNDKKGDFVELDKLSKKARAKGENQQERNIQQNINSKLHEISSIMLPQQTLNKADVASESEKKINYITINKINYFKDFNSIFKNRK